MLSPATHGKIKTYPRALFPDSYCAQAGPSEGASRGVVKRDRLAVAAHGCNTHTQRAAVQAARSRRDRFATPGLLTSAPQLLVRGQAPSRPIAVGRPRQTATAEGDLKTPPTGGRAEQASNTARGTLERRRTCGSTKTGRRPRPRSPFRFGAATHRGPWVRRTPGVPRALGLFSRAHRPNDSDAKRIARTMEVGLRTAAHTLLRLTITPHGAALVSSLQHYATVTKTGTNRCHAASRAPSLGWRACNAYATIQARSSMKTERPIGTTRN